MPVFILSAKYGLISETEIISHYEQTVKSMTKEEKKAMRDALPLKDEYVFIGGDEYKSVLPFEPKIEYGMKMPIGKKMQYLKSLL